MVSINLQSNGVVDDSTSKITQFIYDALKSPTIRLLRLLHQDLCLLSLKSSTTHSGLRYTTPNSISHRLNFGIRLTYSHII